METVLICIKAAAVHIQLCMNYIKFPQTYIILKYRSGQFTIGVILDLNEL